MPVSPALSGRPPFTLHFNSPGKLSPKIDPKGQKSEYGYGDTRRLTESRYFPPFRGEGFGVNPAER
jgi:hypothetical protein